jgi:hypothetical protein
MDMLLMGFKFLKKKKKKKIKKKRWNSLLFNETHGFFEVFLNTQNLWFFDFLFYFILF